MPVSELEWISKGIWKPGKPTSTTWPLEWRKKQKKTGRPTTINQMSAQDRRIVHLALKDDAQVRTQSMGDGYYRRLVIFPKKKNSFKGKRRLRKQT